MVNKIKIFISLFAVAAVLLISALNLFEPKGVSGRVTDAELVDGILSSFVMETDTGERLRVFVADITEVFPYDEDLTAEAFANGSVKDVLVRVVLDENNKAEEIRLEGWA